MSWTGEQAAEVIEKLSDSNRRLADEVQRLRATIRGLDATLEHRAQRIRELQSEVDNLSGWNDAYHQAKRELDSARRAAKAWKGLAKMFRAQHKQDCVDMYNASRERDALATRVKELEAELAKRDAKPEPTPREQLRESLDRNAEAFADLPEQVRQAVAVRVFDAPQTTTPAPDADAFAELHNRIFGDRGTYKALYDAECAAHEQTRAELEKLREGVRTTVHSCIETHGSQSWAGDVVRHVAGNVLAVLDGTDQHARFK